MRRMPALFLGLTLLVAASVTPVGASNFPDEIDLPNGFAPEGITSNGTTLYVGSLAGGAIWRGDLTTGTGDIWIPATGTTAVGIDFEEANNRLWVAGGPTHEVRVYDGTTGSLLGTWTFPDSGFLNDVVVTDDAVYVTDSNVQQLIVIPLGAGGALPGPSEGLTLPLTGDIEYGVGFNANGITAGRGWLLIVQTNTGLVFRVDPATGETSVVVLIEPDGDPYLVTNGDGIELNGNRLAVVRNQLNLVATFKVNGRLNSGTLTGELTSPRFAVPTTATRAAGDLWAVNARFGTPVTPDTEYWITRVPGS
jgi:hypothetical protein